jgi:hypothetical protein
MIMNRPGPFAGAQDHEALPVVRHLEREGREHGEDAEADAGHIEMGKEQHRADGAENDGDEQGDGIHGSRPPYLKNNVAWRALCAGA